MVTTGLIFTVIVMTVAAGFTYIIQYRSVISPCFIEFDDRRIGELRQIGRASCRERVYVLV